MLMVQFLLLTWLLWLGPLGGLANSPTNQFTSVEVTTCGTSSQTGLSIDNFAIIYHRFTRKLDFGLIVTAQQDGIYPKVNIDVMVYGKHAPGQVIDFCAVSGVSCPLPQSSLPIRGFQTLDEAYTGKLPSIAWSVPDLDAIATFTFTSNSSSTELACLRSRLSNGVTANTTAIPWASASITLALLILAAITAIVGGGSSSVSGSGPAGHENIALSHTAPPPTHLHPPHLQIPPQPPPPPPALGPPPAVGVSGLPPGAAPPIGPIHPMAFDGHQVLTYADPHPAVTTQAHVQPTAVNHTGAPAGHMDPITLFLHFQSISSTGLYSLRYPPIYQSFTVNFAWANFILPIGAFKRAVAKLRKCNLNNGPPQEKSVGPIPKVQSGLSISDQTGIVAYAGKVGVPPQDVFGIIYFVFLCACGILIVLYFLVGLVMQVAVWRAKTPERKKVWLARRTRWAEMSSNNSLRIMMLALGTLVTFAFYQWSQSCTSPLVAFLAASAVFVVLFILGIVTFCILRIALRDGQVLFSKEENYGRRWGTLYNMLREVRVWFLVPLLLVVIARGAVTGLGQGHGITQVVIIMVLELIMAINLFYWKPYYSPGYNRVNYLLETTKFISHAMLLLFADQFRINVIAKTVVGIVLLVINSLMALALVILTVLKLGWGTLWFRQKHHAFEDGTNGDRRAGSSLSDRRRKLSKRGSSKWSSTRGSMFSSST